MNGNLVEKLKEFVEKNSFNAEHLIRTVYWLKKLEPKTSKVLVIAALLHDIERAFPSKKEPKRRGGFLDKPGGVNPKYLRWHQERSAKVSSDILGWFEVDQVLIKKVAGIIKKHEFGGTPEADLIKDADSLSFLELNVPIFISWIPEKATKAETQAKFDWMYNRITSPKGKKLAKPFYKKAIKQLKAL